MKIKNLKPNSEGKHLQGYFNPINRKKYNGEYPIIYRSLWEYQFMKVCDTSNKIITWANEKHEIPYYYSLDEKKIIRIYNVDFAISYVNKNNIMRKALIEIKPHNQIFPDKILKMLHISYEENYKVNDVIKFLYGYVQNNSLTPSKKEKTLNQLKVIIKNNDKKKAAEQYAEKHGMVYVVLTEKNIKMFQ